ncbi:hypothetical protein CMUS01_07472 [Colletotrichum musicola]|uniref:Uncharacterized protein n=1 Tax=Colletotrichum musicola TaxID=2175873 RepID=A0A8H6KGB2_9PEZI|nr:hypothetical protein CMUS01_07472 [Colletotrichum musicola]
MWSIVSRGFVTNLRGKCSVAVVHLQPLLLLLLRRHLARRNGKLQVNSNGNGNGTTQQAPRSRSSAERQAG